MSIEKYSNSLPTLRADREEWIEYLGVHPTPRMLEEVGLSPAVWRAILKGLRPLVPLACYRLARFHRYFDLSEALGRAWEGFFLAREALVFPGIKYPLRAEELRTAWLKFQQLGILKSDVALLRHDLEAQERENAALLLALESPAPQEKAPAVRGSMLLGQ